MRALAAVALLSGLLLLLPCCCSGKMTVLSPPSMAGTSIRAPVFQYMGTGRVNFTGYLVPFINPFDPDPDTLTACDPLDLPEGFNPWSVFPPGYVFYLPYGVCPHGDQVANVLPFLQQPVIAFFQAEWQNNEVPATVWRKKNPDWLSGIQMFFGRGGESFPLFVYTVESFASNGTLPPLAVSVIGDRSSYSELVSTGGRGATLSVLLGVCQVALFALALWKLIGFIRVTKPFALTTPIVVLILELIACVLRIAMFLCDPYFWRGNVPYRASQALNDPWFAFTVSTSLFIAMYWQELMTSRDVLPVVSLKRMRIPFMIFFVVLLAFTITIGLARGSQNGNLRSYVQASGIGYGVVDLLVGSYFLWVGARLQHKLVGQTKQSKAGNISRALRRLRWLIFMCGGGHIAFSAVIFFYATTAFWTDRGFFISIVLTQTFGTFITFIHVISFKATAESSNSSSTASRSGHNVSRHRSLAVDSNASGGTRKDSVEEHFGIEEEEEEEEEEEDEEVDEEGDKDVIVGLEMPPEDEQPAGRADIHEDIGLAFDQTVLRLAEEDPDGEQLAGAIRSLYA